MVERSVTGAKTVPTADDGIPGFTATVAIIAITGVVFVINRR
ncbi:PGF-CTERM sorting domain-containing protein [Halovivax gelatinilyticus]